MSVSLGFSPIKVNYKNAQKTIDKVLIMCYY